MQRNPEADPFTLMILPTRTSRVHRIQIPRRLIRRLTAVAAAVALAGLVGLVDYVRLRIDAVDVEQLRTETSAHRAKVRAMNRSMGALEEQLARLREFERKVRVIANLPHTPDDVGNKRDGRGGGDETNEEVRFPEADGEADPDAASMSPMHEPDLSVLPAGAELSPDTLARLTFRAETLSAAALARSTALEDLLEGLEGKTRRLASTPSIWPTEGWLTSRYGYRTSPFTGKRQFHAGIDIATDFNTPVLAPARGRVVFAGRKGPLGRTVVIDHGFGIRTTYGHLAKTMADVGQEVERGEQIAAVGSSGRSTGPHLHYSVETQRRSVDPLDYIFE